MTQSDPLPSITPTIPIPNTALQSIPPVLQATPWSAKDYASSILSKLKEAFPDDADLEKDLAALPELQRLDFENPWRAGAAPPGNDKLLILSLFHADGVGDVSAYVFPIDAIDPTKKIWVRYTLNRMGAASMVEVMPRETFVEEIAAEWEALLTAGDDEEEAEDEEPEAGPSVSS